MKKLNEKDREYLLQVMCPHEFEKISDDKCKCNICGKEMAIVYEIKQ